MDLRYLEDIPLTLECLLLPQVTHLPVKVQTVYVHSVIKIYAYWTSELTSQWDAELQREFVKVTEVMYEKMDMFTHSTDLEVQERAHDVKSLFKIVLDATSNPSVEDVPLILHGLPELFFIYELNPVAPKAQSKVPIPEGLDLDAWINDPLPDLVQEADSDVSLDDSVKYEKTSKSSKKKKSKAKENHSSEDEAEKERRRIARKEARKNDPYYIISENKKHSHSAEFDKELDAIPVVELNIDEINARVDNLKKNRKSKRTKKTVPKIPVYAEEEMPEDAAQSEEEKEEKNGHKHQAVKTALYTKKSARDIFENAEELGLNSVDLSTPLGADEKFQQVKAYLSPEELRIQEEAKYRNERRELRALQKKNKESLDSKKPKKSSSKKETQDEDTGDKKKKKRKSTKKPKKQEAQEDLDAQNLAKEEFVPIDDDVRGALVDGQEEAMKHREVEILETEHVRLTSILKIEANDSPTTVIQFSIQNLDNQKMLPKLHLEFAQSFDLKLIEDNVPTNIAYATETFELQANENVECMAHFEILGNVRQGLCLRGDLFYDIEESSIIHQHAFEIPIPASLFLNSREPMDPTDFATLLAEHGDEFEHHENVSIEIPLPSDTSSIEQVLIKALNRVTATSGLVVVEVVPGAASLYGKSIQGVQIAGLLKYTLQVETEPKFATLSIDLKSTEEGLLEGLVHELCKLTYSTNQIQWLLFMRRVVHVLVAASLFSSPFTTSFVKRRDTIENGSPGYVCYADMYNNLGNDWNRTYLPTEPQQIHTSLLDDSKFLRVQFATLAQVDQSVLIYWPKNDGIHPSRKTTVYGHDWVFVDGGAAKRELYLHNIRTNMLKPDTKFYYQVGAKNSDTIKWSNTYEFHSASLKKDFSFIATGDVGACNSVAAFHMMEYGKTHKYDFVTIAGDQAYDMSDFDGAKGDEYLNFMQELFANVPYLGSVGNHESAYNFTHYKNRFNIVPYSESKFDNPLMYSINYKSLHLVSFSTEIYFEGSDDEIKTGINWLEADLTEANKHRHERPWIIVMTHHPMYCSIASSDCTTNAEKIRNGPGFNSQSGGGIEDILLKHKVDIYMSGHVHNYERTYPVAHGNLTSTSYHNAPSFFQLVIGNAGQPEGPSQFDENNIPEFSAFRYSGYGFSTFKVTPTAMHIVHRKAEGNGAMGSVVDYFTVTKDRHKKCND
ncbi:hypothetical protein G6F56_004568 [Rhizopus delemar]|nr:hypothetical protein G6F56_004568 [Rhizopus delemar]